MNRLFFISGYITVRFLFKIVRQDEYRTDGKTNGRTDGRTDPILIVLVDKGHVEVPDVEAAAPPAADMPHDPQDVALPRHLHNGVMLGQYTVECVETSEVGGVGAVNSDVSVGVEDRSLPPFIGDDSPSPWLLFSIP